MANAVEQVVEMISGMTAVELSELKTALEDKFGVTAAAPAMGMVMAAPGTTETAPAEEEKSTFDVVLTDVGANKLQVIKTVRDFTSLGLKEAKDLVESAPKAVKEGAQKEEAEKIKAALEEVGAKAELK